VLGIEIGRGRGRGRECYGNYGVKCTYGPAAGNAFAVLIFFIALLIVMGVIENWRVIDGR
jgi:hypothetical protein